MLSYEQLAFAELSAWEMKFRKKPSIPNRMAKFLQTKINNLIPDKIHQAITFAIEKMVKGVLFGSRYLTASPLQEASLQVREIKIRKKIEWYKNTASAEGAVTGAGGILMGFADFPALLAIKIQLLFEVAALYGYQVKDYKERLFILHIFQLAFSSQRGRNELIEFIADWDNYSKSLSEEVDDFDWRNFQLEYRDYIDLAKMAQLVPIIGAGVGAIANYKLVQLLGNTAMNCYRMRYFRNKEIDGGE
ncbi:MAG: EcsC family protein [Anditalea sp.]